MSGASSGIAVLNCIKRRWGPLVVTATQRAGCWGGWSGGGRSSWATVTDCAEDWWLGSIDFGAGRIQAISVDTLGGGECLRDAK